MAKKDNDVVTLTADDLVQIYNSLEVMRRFAQFMANAIKSMSKEVPAETAFLTAYESLSFLAVENILRVAGEKIKAKLDD